MQEIALMFCGATSNNRFFPNHLSQLLDVSKVSFLFQNYLREQPDNIKSVNLVGETTKFLNILYSNINSQSIPLITQVFDTLVEFTSVSIHQALSYKVSLKSCYEWSKVA